MKQTCVGKDTVKGTWQLQFNEVLMEHLAATVNSRHLTKLHIHLAQRQRATKFVSCFKSLPGPQQNPVPDARRLTLVNAYRVHQVLRDVMISRTFPELFGSQSIVGNGVLHIDFNDCFHCGSPEVLFYIYSSHRITTENQSWFGYTGRTLNPHVHGLSHDTNYLAT